MQRRLTPLQSYHPDVHLDAFEPPSEGDSVSEFAQSISWVLAEAAPGTDAAFARQEADAIMKRAQAIYATTSDDVGLIFKDAEQRAAARVAKV